MQQIALADKNINIKQNFARYTQLSAAHLDISQNLSHKTYPNDKGNSFEQQYYLYSPTSANGHNVYLHYQDSRSPNDEQKLKQGSYGIGANINFYPLFIRAEVGHGTMLNKRGYTELDLKYRINQSWAINVNGNINTQTPVKAAYTDIYTKGISSSLNYSSNKFSLNLGASVLKFSDNNLRRRFYTNANLIWFKYDRWQINQSIAFDYVKNRNISSAFYYNPLNSQNIETEFDISYWQPFNYSLQLTHHLRSSVGHYWQKDQNNSNFWSVSYQQQWNIGKKLAISVAIGRNKNIYDGEPEFNNFANLGLSIYFY